MLGLRSSSFSDVDPAAAALGCSQVNKLNGSQGVQAAGT
jgi:hypothetical protein